MSMPDQSGTPDGGTRTELLKPVQLLGIAFACAVFAGVVTAVSTGVFTAPVGVRALPLAGIVAGITFIVTLVGLALLLLVVDPRTVTGTVDRGVLLDPEPAPGEAVAGAAPSASAPRSVPPSAPDVSETPDATASPDDPASTPRG